MPRKQDRSNAYYENILASSNPAIFSDYRAGMYRSLRQALLAAGIKKIRTRDQELKNAWQKASKAERQEFMRWLSAQSGLVTPSGAKVGNPPLAVERRLEPWAITRINAIMRARHLSSGDVMKEIGFSNLDPSLGFALIRGLRLQPTVLTALETWLSANSAV